MRLSRAIGIYSVVISIFVVGSVVCSASQSPNKSELKHMISTAHTPNDFQQLADYCDQRSAEFESKAQEQQKELDRLLALPFHARSYPTQVATTRDLISKYKTQASSSAEQAREYRERAETLSGATPSRTASPAK
jgi:hypothetical protein